MAWNASSIFIHQRKYALDILSDHSLTNCKPVKCPLELQHNLTVSAAPLLADPHVYRRLVGRLIYLTITRPDLSYVVHFLSQFVNASNEDHLKAALRVLRYVISAPAAQGFMFSASAQFSLRAFCDADWAACPQTRRSITGFCGDSLVSWQTKKQVIVSCSSAISEYRGRCPPLLGRLSASFAFLKI